MKEIQLKPIKETPSDFDKLEEALIQLFKRELYLPLMKILGKSSRVLTNSLDDLLDAIKSGRVTYDRGSFRGDFSAAISRELKNLGATWDRKQSAWKIPKSSLPVEVKSTISSSYVVFDEKLKRIDRKLQQIIPEEFAERLQASNFFDATLWKVEQSLQETLKKIMIAPQLSDEARKRISDEWQTNIRMYVKEFTEEEILNLRTQIRKSTFAGNRYESAVKTIQKSFGVSERKAKFLARQETSLLLTKYKEVRYQDAGVNEYRWTCVHMPKDTSPKQHTPGNVRYYHGLLDKNVYRFDTPPIVDAKGNRKNPGEDYNCRCVAQPIVRFK